MSTPNVRTKIVNVEITNNAGAPNGIGFALNDGGGPTSTIGFQNNSHPGVMVYFRIDDIGNTGLLFRPDPRDALWVAQGNQNPLPNQQWPGFVPLSVENSRRKLLVYCRNSSPPEQFKFTLWFLDQNGKAIDYDPIGDGLNGPRGGF
jgi:hypothetical protein